MEMENQAEFAKVVMEEEAKLVVPEAIETNNEVSESASRAAAMIALNETAAQKDWDQDRLEAAQAGLESKFSEAPRPGGLVEAIEDARTTATTEERTHAAALAATDQAARRAALLGIEDLAAHQNWPQERVDDAIAKVEAKYS